MAISSSSGERLCEVGVVVPPVLRPGELEDPRPDAVGQPPGRGAAPVAVRDALRSAVQHRRPQPPGGPLASSRGRATASAVVTIPASQRLTTSLRCCSLVVNLRFSLIG